MRPFRIIATLWLLALPLPTTAPPQRPKISGIDFVRLRVTNIDASRKFYEDVLKLSRSSRWCYRAEATCYLLNPFQNLEILPLEKLDSNGVDAIGFWVSDVHLLRSYLSAHGVKSEDVVANSLGEDCIGVHDAEHHQIIFASLKGGIAGSLMQSPARVSDRMIHAGLVIRDRSGEDHFYKDILGFRLYWHGGMKDEKDDWVAMQVPDGTDWLEYMLNVPADASHHTLGVMNHISLGVTDIHATEKQLIANGWKPTEEPKIGRDGKWQLNVYDPDDTRVEFMEFKPAQQPCCNPFTGPHPGPRN